ncbi:carbonic anhydrase [Woodsholea maritima]|uniref:carbonic anhydrase n=1 Tax=Woodsholea maritima TaxID=240237 RepID=UPI0003728BBB|nr:carbonic anhydrase [Woodsholea maritima]
MSDAAKALIAGFRRFRAHGFTKQRELYEELEKGQSPHTLIIACSDSRVDPAEIFDARPGELFVVRNVANLVPPYDHDGGRHGVSAALEFAVKALKVKNILVMGHGQCGGVAACAHGIEKLDFEFVGPWLEPMLPAREASVEALGESDIDALSNDLELRSVEYSVARLKEFPFVAEAIAERGLTLHGARFSIATGELEWMSPEGAFDRVAPSEVA